MSVEVYRRVRSVVADKADGSTWEHKFTTPARIIGKADGSLSIRSSRGKRLHKKFPFKGRQEPFLVNPPRRNAWSEEREIGTASIFKAPRHRAAAIQGWLFRDRAAERKVRPTIGRGRRRKRSAQPRALAHYHAREMKGRTLDPASRNPPMTVSPAKFRANRLRALLAQGYSRKAAERLADSQLRFQLRHETGSYSTPRKYRKISRTKKNPLLQILNPPRKKNMRTGKMPPGLARYWRSRRAKRANPKRRRHARLARTVHHKRRRRVAKENPFMAKHRKHRRRRAASAVRHNSNPRRHHRRRRNPPFRLGGSNMMHLGKQAAGVATGIIAPTMILKAPGIPAMLIDTPLKRIATKIGVGYLVSIAGRKFIGREFGNMVLVGLVANVLMADVFPRVMPSTGVGLAEGYDDLPMLSEFDGQGYQRQLAALSEISGGQTFEGEHENVNEFATA